MGVPAAYTSQRCSVCRTVDPVSRESQAVYRCTACGHFENADVNAAKNVLADGLSVAACGDLGSTRSVKQEPAGNRKGLPLQPRLTGWNPPATVVGRTSTPPQAPPAGGSGATNHPVSVHTPESEERTLVDQGLQH
ncbi:zinc ribbon domain-containing protein [Kibdelosporangium lantanae]|uniref:Zinc ribbon domain-containing protein n=1 Tax=Kibdelosporangium lantanae TaxID=1497396 RepID=A0ABW3M6R9_9PSEU